MENLISWSQWLNGYGQSLGVMVVLFVATWIISLIKRDYSIVDQVWGLSFLGVALYLNPLPAVLQNSVKLALLAGVALWSIRLSGHIHLRHRGKPEDYRYQKMRAGHGAAYWWKSFTNVYLLQALIASVVNLPLLAVWLHPHPTSPQAFGYIGLAIFGLGWLYESVADWQLYRFKKNHPESGALMNHGLWRLSRHPNYFGESLVWWGLALYCFDTTRWLGVFISPTLMTFLLLRVSGVRMLDAELARRKPEFASYARTTPGFFPAFHKIFAPHR